MKKLRIKAYGKYWNVVFFKDIYCNNGNTAIITEAYKLFKRKAEPFCDLTVNLHKLNDADKAYIDVNGCPHSIIEKLTDKGLIIPTGIERQSGFVNYPLYTLTDKFLNEWCESMQ